MVKTMYLKCWEVLRKKPLALWGVSLLGVLLTALAECIGVLPVISIPVAFVIQAGMALVYLRGYKGERVEAEQVFDGFNNFWHVLGGMAWMALWIFIWSLIPIVGVVFGVMKAYEYRFTPHILMTRPEVPATEALKVSMKRTEGYKGSMFLCDLIIAGAIFAVCLVLVLLGFIPFVGYVFWALLPLFTLAAAAVSPLCFGLLGAAFFVESENPAAANGNPAGAGWNPTAANENPNTTNENPAAEGGQGFCAQCGSPVSANQKFCSRCGAQQA